MKTILIGINSKYIHPNLALRYLKANTTYDVQLQEYTIKDDPKLILSKIIDQQPDVLGFSVYIWNVEIIRSLLKDISELNLNIKIILGGPEVSYVNEDYFKLHLTDYIIVNEGEESFHLLLDAINNHLDLSDIPNLIYMKDNIIIKNKTALIEDLNHIKDPYFILKNEDYIHKIQYVELSRGCPYRCSYCLASLEKGLRFFSLDRVKETINQLVQNGARTFKFLDRSFNANPKLAQEFLDYIIKQNYENVVFQFEINGDVLRDDFIEFLIEKAPKDLIRFELGIQSTNDLVNKEVNRYQNTEKLIQNIVKLKQSNVTMHLDLIAGLPYEDLESFKDTFNTIYQLFPDELQLGFLKVLKGTDIYYKANKHLIKYDEVAPYEIIDNQYITKDELAIIHEVETMLNIYWNKNFMNTSIEHLTKNVNAFDFYRDLHQYFIKNQYPTLRYHFNDLFIYLIGFLKENNLWNHTIESYLKYDFLMHHPIKPQIYWKNDINKNDIIRQFHQFHPEKNIDELYKYSLVTDYLDGYLMIVYKPNLKEVYEIKND